MGLSAFLKKLFPPGENPLRSMEPQCIQYRWVTVRLPLGWQFTKAEGLSFTASGPGPCEATFFLAAVNSGRRPFMAADFEKERKKLITLMGTYALEGKAGPETVLPNGVVWMEATDTHKGSPRLRVALVNPRPRNEDRIPPMLQVTCTMPAGSTAGGLTAERFEALRAALRSAEWN